MCLVYSMSGQRTVNEDLKSYPSIDLRAGVETDRFRFDNFEVARDLIVNVARTVLRVTLEGRGSECYTLELCRMLLLAVGLPKNEARELCRRPLPTDEPPPGNERRRSRIRKRSATWVEADKGSKCGMDRLKQYDHANATELASSSSLLCPKAPCWQTTAITSRLLQAKDNPCTQCGRLHRPYRC